MSSRLAPARLPRRPIPTAVQQCPGQHRAEGRYGPARAREDIPSSNQVAHAAVARVSSPRMRARSQPAKSMFSRWCRSILLSSSQRFPRARGTRLCDGSRGARTSHMILMATYYNDAWDVFNSAGRVGSHVGSADLLSGRAFSTHSAEIACRTYARNFGLSRLEGPKLRLATCEPTSTFRTYKEPKTSSCIYDSHEVTNFLIE